MNWADAIVLAISALAIGLALGGFIGLDVNRDRFDSDDRRGMR